MDQLEQEGEEDLCPEKLLDKGVLLLPDSQDLADYFLGDDGGGVLVLGFVPPSELSLHMLHELGAGDHIHQLLLHEYIHRGDEQHRELFLMFGRYHVVLHPIPLLLLLEETGVSVDALEERRYYLTELLGFHLLMLLPFINDGCLFTQLDIYVPFSKLCFLKPLTAFVYT